MNERIDHPDPSDKMPFDKSDSDLDDELYPSIFDWSLDYWVVTLPFISRGRTYTRYRKHLDDLRYLLGSRKTVTAFKMPISVHFANESIVFRL